MANNNRALEINVQGQFFVDDSCINCDTCRQLAPKIFEEDYDLDYSFVKFQPVTGDDYDSTYNALISCPTNSIGSYEDFDKKSKWKTFPLILEDEVYYCGFNSPKSFGGNSYLILHPEGNWLIDSPRYSKYLSQKFKELGGIRYIFLTHRDDVADAEKYAAEYENCERIIHYYDKSADKTADIKIKGEEEVQINLDFKIIPTPGHTKGHMVLLYKNKFLFTGDHMSWRRDWNGLRASRSYCWWNWKKQVESIKKLQQFRFEWVLPGHGSRKNLSNEDMKNELNILIDKVTKSDYW